MKNPPDCATAVKVHDMTKDSHIDPVEMENQNPKQP